MSGKNIRSIFTHCYLKDLLVIRLCRHGKDDVKSCEKRTQIIHNDYSCKNSVCVLTIAKSSHG